ncbi:MAG: hypothetical protein ACRDGT_01180 [Candidatus Limnocylindria bacterium]
MLETTVTADQIELMIPDAVGRGERAVVRARTAPSAECFIDVTSTSGARVADLRSKYADGVGEASWSWTVDETAAAGEWLVEVTCTTASGIRAVATGTLLVR